MVLGPEQVTWTTIFHNYLRSSVTNFRGPRSENMSRGQRWCRSPGSSVVQVTGVIGGVCHRGHQWCMSPGSTVVQVTGVIGGAGHRGHWWCMSLGSSVLQVTGASSVVQVTVGYRWSPFQRLLVVHYVLRSFFFSYYIVFIFFCALLNSFSLIINIS